MGHRGPPGTGGVTRIHPTVVATPGSVLRAVQERVSYRKLGQSKIPKDSYVPGMVVIIGHSFSHFPFSSFFS